MGFKVSWIGFDGKAKADALEVAGLKDTGELDQTNEAPFSGAEIPGGWFILFSNDFSFVSRPRLAHLSSGCRIVACQVHEGTMASAAYGYESGNCAWELAHDGQQGISDLSVFGSPPPSFESIRQRLTEKQKTMVHQSPYGVDYIFDIPVKVAASICKYRHDRWKFEWGQPLFTRLDLR